MSKINYKSNISKKQHPKQTNITFVRKLNQEFSSLAHAEGFFIRSLERMERTSPKRLRAFSTVIHRIMVSLKFGKGQCYFSQENAAQLTGMSRVWMNRVLQDFVKEGWLIKINRGVKKTCLYYVNPLLMHPTIRYALKKFIPSLGWLGCVALSVFSLVAPFAAVGGQFEKDFTQYFLEKSNIKNSPRESCSLYVRALKKDHFSRSGGMLLQKSKEARMEEKRLSLIEQLLPTESTLTRVEKALLLAFEEKILTQALGALKKEVDVEKPFLWLFAVCSRAYFRCLLQPDWALIDQYAAAHSLWVNKTPSLARLAQEKYDDYKQKIEALSPRHSPTIAAPPRASNPDQVAHRQQIAQNQARIAAESPQKKQENASAVRAILEKLYGPGHPLVHKMSDAITRSP